MKHPITAGRLRDALASSNLTAADLSNLTDVAPSSISQYINGRVIPSNVSAGKMAKVLGVNPAWLMGFDVPRTLEVDAPVELNREAALKALELYEDPRTRPILDVKRRLTAHELDALMVIVNKMID